MNSENLPTLPCLNEPNMDLDSLLVTYFDSGFTYLEIKEFLSFHHGNTVSLSTIKRHLKKMNLVRRPLSDRRISQNDLNVLVREVVSSSGGNMGYRRVWQHLKRKGVVARREDIRLAILAADPVGVEFRKRKRLRRRKYFSSGLNSVWHLDGHDKLKPYGFSIHGCIDGFSRRIIWLDVSSSNKKPELIATYYLNAVKQLGGVPKKLKADDGTEHSLIEPIHIALRDIRNDEDVISSFSIVTSPLNQRIEAYWSKLKQDRMGWWKRLFQDMLDLDMFDPSDPVVLDCARFCFMTLIRKELIGIANEWNQHIISKSLNGGPSGRPDTMYFLPHLFDCANHMQPVRQDEVSEFEIGRNNLPLDFTLEFKEFAKELMHEEGLSVPSDAHQALELYIFLLEKIALYSE